MRYVSNNAVPGTDTKDVPGLFRVACACVLVVCAMLIPTQVHASVQEGVVPEPQVVTVQIPTGLLVYDLAWSLRAEESCKFVAGLIAAKMHDPSMLYIVDLPQLPRHWTAMRWTSSTVDMFGYPIDRKRILRGMHRYERDVDRALVGVLDELEKVRPGALMSVKNFMPSGDGQYELLAWENDFMVQDVAPSASDAAYFAGLYEELLLASGAPGSAQLEQDIKKRMVTDSFDAEALGYGLMIVHPELSDWAILAPGELPDFELLAASQWVGNELVLAETVDSPAPTQTETSTTSEVDTFTNADDSSTEEDNTTTDEGETTAGQDVPATDENTTADAGGTTDTSGGTTTGSTQSTTDSSDPDIVAGTDSTIDTTEPTTTQEPGGSVADPEPAPAVSLVYPAQTAKPWSTVISNGDSAVRGADTKVISRWGTVPYQVFESAGDAVSVYAFHRNGIERVEFYVDGLLSATVIDSVNGEYSLAVDVATFPDGKHELQAIVYPVHGLVRSLAGAYDIQRQYGGSEWTGEYTLEFFTNAGGSVEVEVVELQAGTYRWGGPDSAIYNGLQQHKDRWFIYRPAPGVRQDQVIINAGLTSYPSGTWYRDFEKIKLEGLTINGHAGMLNYYSEQHDMLWLDNVVINGPGMHDPSGSYSQAKHQWWTDTRISDSRDGMARQFVKGCTFTNIGEDVIREGNLVVDVKINNVDATGTLWHAGVIANPLFHDNRIYSNVEMLNIGAARAWPMRQGTYGHWANTDVAIVNCRTQQTDPSQMAMYCGGSIENMIIVDSQFDGRVEWRVATSISEEWRFTPRNAQSMFLSNVSRLDGSYIYISEIYGVERID